MGFTVHHVGPAKDAEYRDYERTLRQQGVDLGHVPRVPDPDTRQRWLCVWDTQDKAEAFAKELTKRTRDKGCASCRGEGPPLGWALGTARDSTGPTRGPDAPRPPPPEQK